MGFKKKLKKNTFFLPPPKSNAKNHFVCQYYLFEYLFSDFENIQNRKIGFQVNVIEIFST